VQILVGSMSEKKRKKDQKEKAESKAPEELK
jgi:hypothetical protein